MNFTVSHARQATGSDLQVYVSTHAAEFLCEVAVVLDGSSLLAVELPPGTECYARTFAAVGAAGPRFEHALEVTAVDQHGTPHRSITGWTDSC